MNKEKQIEEMAHDLARKTAWDEDEIPTINCLETAKRLYAAGYRKQRKGEWIETQREWDFDPFFYTDYTCSVCGDREQDKRHFCPNCGAKMGGGAE